MDKRKTCVMVRYTGDPKGYRWLTKKELALANELKASFYPTVHRGDGVDMECPAPEICGYIIYDDDWERVQAMVKFMRKRK